MHLLFFFGCRKFQQLIFLLFYYYAYYYCAYAYAYACAYYYYYYYYYYNTPFNALLQMQFLWLKRKKLYKSSKCTALWNFEVVVNDGICAESAWS